MVSPGERALCVATDGDYWLIQQPESLCGGATCCASPGTGPGRIAGYRRVEPSAMQDCEYGLPRTPLLGTWVNKPMMALVRCLQRPNNTKNSSFGGCAFLTVFAT